MTMRDKWNCLKARLFVTDPSEHTITNERAERIQRQVANIESIAIEHARAIGKGLSVRLAVLEGRAENVDAFYVKTVTQALSESQAKHYHALNEYIGGINENLGGRIDQALAHIDAVVNQLREERERINDQVKRHGALVSKLRAGLE